MNRVLAALALAVALLGFSPTTSPASDDLEAAAAVPYYYWSGGSLYQYLPNGILNVYQWSSVFNQWQLLYSTAW